MGPGARGGAGEETDQQLYASLRAALGQCSRQRLRAVHMSLRSHSTPDSRVGAKDLLQILQARSLGVLTLYLASDAVVAYSIMMCLLSAA